MLVGTDKLACCKVATAAFAVRNLQQVRRDRTAVIFSEAVGYIVTAWPFGGFVERSRVFHQLLHPLAVWSENLTNICLRPLRLGEPPHRIYGIFHSQLPLV